MSRVTVNIDTNALRARLGLTEQQLPDEASEAQIAAAFAGSPQRCECGGLHASAQEFDRASVPDDMVLMEREQWNSVQQRLNVVANYEMTSLLDNAGPRT